MQAETVRHEIRRKIKSKPRVLGKMRIQNKIQCVVFRNRIPTSAQDGTGAAALLPVSCRWGAWGLPARYRRTEQGGSEGAWSLFSSHWHHCCCILHSPLSCTEWLWPFNHTAHPVPPSPLSPIHRHSWICPLWGESDSSRLIRMFNVEQQNYFVRRIKHRQIHW